MALEKLDLDKNESSFLDETISFWQKQGLIDESTAKNLQNSYTVKGFDWKRLAQYSFWVALFCGLIAIASLIIDDKVLNWLKQLYNTPDILISLFSGVLAAFLFFRGARLKKVAPQKVFSNEAVIFLGILFTATCIAYLGKTFDNGSGHYSLLFLLSVFVYGFIAYKLHSHLIWLFALISLGSWFGTETGYQTDWRHYFLGMNYPLRFVVFGGVLVAFCFVLRKKHWLGYFREFTYIVGMAYLFCSLWLLSIFGNFGTIDDWLRVKQITLFYWALISIAVSVAFVLYGLKKKDEVAREFGITFLLINIYTRYTEYLWENINRTLFFAILGLSFWLIGRKAEKIWNLDTLKGKTE